MIKVLVQRIPLDERLTKVTCRGCQSELEYTPKIDAQEVGEGFYRFSCPVCKHNVYDAIS